MMWRQMNAWIIMVAAGKTRLLISLPARTHFVVECVNVLWLMVFSSKEMVIALVPQVDVGDANSTMEAVGMSFEMVTLSLLVWITRRASAHVLQGLKVMVLKAVKILMNAEKRKHVNALNAAAKIRGAVMSAVAVGNYCKRAREVKSAWAAVWAILIGLAMAGGGAYLVYKYRLRRSGLLWHNICRWTAKAKSKITSTRIMLEIDIVMPPDIQNEVQMLPSRWKISSENLDEVADSIAFCF
ncbi:hypothetical protein MTR67_006167 [Solanum verrucosum]|uniref:Transmembrane protein n=1 Tax=Solanum verrucosum TaxID=315347 RepID=A0AAF0PXR9_SOLVR|nr:hypothetical protein MTR67_006167 [Solanum verrucosum]